MRMPMLHAIATVAALAVPAAMAASPETQASEPKRIMSRLFRMPGLVTRESDPAVFVVSDRVTGWLLAEKQTVKSVSPGDGPVSEDYTRYSRVGVYAVVGVKGRWLVTMYQCNSRAIAMNVAKSFFVLNSLRAAPNLTWDGRDIGEMSAGHHVEGKPDKPWQNAVFVRGNVAVAIYSEPVDGKHHDPRRIAAIIDSYLACEPKAKKD